MKCRAYGRLGSVVMRRALLGALAAVIVLPACASASSTSSDAPSAAAPSTSLASSTATTAQPRVRKPITVKVGAKLFGLHDTSMDSLAKPGVGSLRLWDAGVMWRDLEPAEGTFDWARLDQYVAEAHADHTEVTLVLAGTPAWAVDPITASTPASPWDAPDVAKYRSFVTAVMQRYAPGGHFPYRGIANYQVWNEPNIKNFWNGSFPQMAQLVQTTFQVRRHVDRGAKVLGPSLVTRLPYEMKAVQHFYATVVNGTPVWKYVDATTFSLYPVATIDGRMAGPEDSMALLKGVRAKLAAAHVPKRIPIWDSEINYGYTTGNTGPATQISPARQAANVLRTYILNAAAGVPRVFWYRYDLTSLDANTHMVELDDPTTLSAAGHAFYLVQKWLKGATLVGTATTRPCTKDRNGTYTCVVRYGTGMGRIYWNPTKTVKKRTVRSTRSWQSGLGVLHRVGHRVTLRVNYLPVLVRSRS